MKNTPTNLETFVLGLVFLGAQRPSCFALMDRIGERQFDRIGGYIKRGMVMHAWVTWSEGVD